MQFLLACCWRVMCCMNTTCEDDVLCSDARVKQSTDTKLKCAPAASR
jgi:hypothetical protein